MSQDDTSKKNKQVETLEVSKTKETEPVEKVGLGSFIRIFSYSTTSDRIYLFIGSLSSIGAGVALPLMNIVFGRLVGSFTKYFIPGSGVTLKEFHHAVNQNALFIVYLFIGKFVLQYIAMFSYRFVGIRLSATLRLAYLRSLFSQPISSLDKKPPGEAANTITNSANVIQVGISEKLSIFLQSFVMIISAYAIAFRYSWLMTLVVSSAFLFICLVYGPFVPIFIKAQRGVDQADEKASSIASEVFQAVRIIVACGAETRMASRYNKWVEESRRRGLRMSLLHGLNLSPMFFATYGSFGLCFWFGIRLYHEGKIHSISNVVIVFSSVMMVITASAGLVAPLLAVSKAASAATGFFKVLDVETPNTMGLKEPDVSASEDIALNNVTFAYPSRPNIKVLNDLSITFEKNKVTAIVGPSGSGKSTIVGLLQRWYEINPNSVPQPESEEVSEKDEIAVPCSGSVTIGGRNILDTDMKWWRNSAGLVQQEPFVFSDTIFNNIAHGLCGSKWEHEDFETKKKLVEDACKEAYADEFIRRLPDGYNTQVGESGFKLSGGQRQRIAIARAIIKRPSILLLDEATSSIDVRGERIVQAALDHVSKNRTTITIAHRLSTIKRADKIIVMTKGSAVEQGTHEELLQNEDGIYYGLVHAQELMMIDTLPTEILEGAKSSPMIDVEDIGEVSEEHPDVSATGNLPYKAKGFIQSFGLLLYEQKHRWAIYAVTIISAMGCAVANPLQAFLFAKIVTAFQLTGSALIHASEHWGLMFFFLALGVGIMYMILGISTNILSVHVSSTYRQEYFESIIQKPAVFFDQKDNSSGTLTARLANDPVQLQQLLGANMAMVYVAVFQVIGSISVAFAFGWKLTIVALFASMPIIFAAGFYRVQYEIQFERLNAEVFAESSQFASEAIGAYRTVTSLTLEEMIINRYAALLQGHVSSAFKKARWATLIFAAADSISLLCMALTFWYGGRLLGSHEYNSVQFFVIYVAIIQGSEAAGQFSSFGPNIAQASAAANRILAFRNLSDKKANSTKTERQSGGVKIEFDNVHFTYPTREVPILRGLSLTIEKGQFAAIVGPSGCGKTTIVSLLERFYDIQHGTICYDDTDISQIPVATYRSGVSLVAQEPTLFQGSIRENIMLGVEPTDVTDEDMYSASRDAEIHEFISSLEEGYNTDIGSKGVALSGGQRQRISIARALLRSPQLLLLDEATSSLDSDTEKLVQGAFERIGKKHAMTMVVVAHRLATVQNADVIFVLGEGGKLVEKGKHGELLGKRGVYWQMCQAQALDR